MIPLKDLLQHARHEIEASARERIASGEAPLLRVETVTIEAHVVVTTSGGGGGGFSLGVVTASGKADFQDQQVQKITVVLKTIEQAALAANWRALSAPATSDPPPSHVSRAPAPNPALGRD